MMHALVTAGETAFTLYVRVDEDDNLTALVVYQGEHSLASALFNESNRSFRFSFLRLTPPRMAHCISQLKKLPFTISSNASFSLSTATSSSAWISILPIAFIVSMLFFTSSSLTRTHFTSSTPQLFK